MKRKLLTTIYALWVMVLFIAPLTFGHSVEGTSTKTITGTMEATVADAYEDSQWQYFTTECKLDETVVIELTYSGDLDIDLWVFIDETTTGSDQKNFAADLTHCESESKPTLYSAKKVEDTKFVGPEEVQYTNIEFETTRKLTILVFVRVGTGKSSYVLSANNVINVINDDDIEQCWMVWQAWGIFAAGCLVMSFIIIKLAKRAARTPDEKAALKLAKDEKNAAKGKKKKKKKGDSSMASRRGGSANRR